MRPTDILKDEHRVIKAMLKITQSVCDRLEKGESVPALHLKEIVTFIQEFADRCHHAKEEDLLFPAMEDAGVPRQGGPLAVMLSEHAEGREYVRNMKEAAEKYGAGDVPAAARFVENGRGYAALLSQHIDKEDNILYRIADARLSPAVQSDMESAFERVEEEVVGRGKHEEFHALLEKLEKTYLG